MINKIQSEVIEEAFFHEGNGVNVPYKFLRLEIKDIEVEVEVFDTREFGEYPFELSCVKCHKEKVTTAYALWFHFLSLDSPFMLCHECFQSQMSGFEAFRKYVQKAHSKKA